MYLLDAERSRGETIHDGRRGDRPHHLGDAEQDESDRPDDPDEEERQRDVGIKQSASDTVEEPGGDEETKPHRRRDIERVRDGGPALERLAGGGLDTAQTEKEEKSRPDELDGCGFGVYGEGLEETLGTPVRGFRFGHVDGTVIVVLSLPG